MKSQGLLLGIFGVWVLFQTIAGDLPGRLLSYAKSSPKTAKTAQSPVFQPGTGPVPATTYPYVIQPIPGGGTTVAPLIP